MANPIFNIYNASAGSGKTYTLAKSYLKILLQSRDYEKFRYILALTFTNKAAGEMKARIIEMLKVFSEAASHNLPHPMLNDISKELSLPKEIIHQKSKHILKHIVHNYGAFDISTIDGFAHRIIRTFAQDLNLSQNFEVELDQERLLNEAVDSLIARAGSDSLLTDILVDFAIEKTDDDKSWDISYDFNKISKLLINESDLLELQKLKHKSLEDFKKLKSQLAADISLISEKIKTSATSALILIEEAELNTDDFTRKSLPNHFQNLKNGKFDLVFNSNWQTDLVDGGTLYPKRVSEDIASKINSLQPQLSLAFQKTKDLVFLLRLKKGFYKNITPLSVLNAIKSELNTIKEEKNILLISEFNSIISTQIKDQPTPFIYERLGEKFKHFFIDEFQDTSIVQWANLLPLLDNALAASDGSVLLVGDAKQSIYRWRGGEPEQFIKLYQAIDRPFSIDADVRSLDTNYRSAKAIIAFNNAFFQFISANFLNEPEYAKLYQNSKQESHQDLEGYVDLSFLDIKDDDDSDLVYADKVLKTITHCQDKGYELEDICVIVRKRKEGVAMAKYLSEHHINITSSETLLLKNSKEVCFLNAMLKLLLQPQNDNLKITVLTFLAEQLDIQDKHLFFSRHLQNDLNHFFEVLKPIGFSLNRHGLLQLPLYELIETLLREFKLNTTSNAYLQFYLDVVLEFSQKQNSDLSTFISYFEEEQERLSVVLPEDLNAVQIMTIHKSKGLEFPVVIFPYAVLDVYKELDPKIWFPTDRTAYQDFETLLLNYNKDLEQFGPTGEALYQKRQSQLELDNINLLYVVLTRAVEQLYIISEKKELDTKEGAKIRTYSGMLIAYLQNIGLWTENNLHYSFGAFKPKQHLKIDTSASQALKLISVPKEAHNLNIISQSGLLWDTSQEKAMERGNLVHLILSKIITKEDIDFAFEELLNSGILSSNHLTDLKASVAEVINHPKLSLFFGNSYKVYNERDIITETGALLRPDRINISPKDDVTIIDYKTGEKLPSHAAQLSSYQSVLERMDLSITKKLLVYINDSVEVIEV